MGEWTFFSNHGHVLVCLARDREARLRDVAVKVGITERAVQKIVRDMQDAGYLEISKHGRRNRYRINNRKSLRHSLHAGCTVGQLIQLLNRQAAAKQKTADQAAPVAVSAVDPAPARPPEEASLPVREEIIKPEPAKPAKTSKKPSKTDLEQGSLF